MRSMMLRSLLDRSGARLRRPLQGLIAVSALFLLTGAKGGGCSNVEVQDEPDSAPSCEPGTHAETVCTPCAFGDMCEVQCVPDSQCPPGTVEQWVCYASCEAEGCPPPPPCELQCVPEDPCGDGYHQEWICEPPGGSGNGSSEPGDPGDSGGGSSGSGDPGGSGNGSSEPGYPGDPSPGECFPICAPDSICPPGTAEQTVCDPWQGGDDPSEPIPPDAGCWTECVPVPACPPGTIEQVVCGPDEPQPGQDPNESSPGSPCWTECVPVPACPPGTVEQVVCDPDQPPPPDGGQGPADPSDPDPEPGVCWTECVPIDVCPDGTLPVTVCDPDQPQPQPEPAPEPGAEPMPCDPPDPGPNCWLECVPPSYVPGS